MKQKISAILNDDRGVSPVIGVILMVAITVILAAVIGTFVLGLGDSLNQAPQSQLNAEMVENSDNEQLEISHSGGDSIPTADLRIVINGEGDNSVTVSNVQDSDASDSEFGVGDSLTIVPSDGEDASGTTFDSYGETTVQVIHTPSESIILNTEVTFSTTT